MASLVPFLFNREIEPALAWWCGRPFVRGNAVCDARFRPSSSPNPWSKGAKRR